MAVTYQSSETEIGSKDVKRLAQPRADKFIQNVGKVRKVKTFQDGLAYTPKWLVAEHRLHKVVIRVGQLQAACLTKIKFRNQIIVESGKPMPDSFY